MGGRPRYPACARTADTIEPTHRRATSVVPIDVSCLVDRQVRTRLGRTRVEQLELPGRILELSISGAGIEGPAALRLPSGAAVVLRVHETHSTVRVIRSAPGAEPRALVYGVVFVRLDPRFQRPAPRSVTEDRPR
jgi:hypothetical protein